MTRWTFRILLCMFLGAVTTVGVAWGLAVSKSWADAKSIYVEANDHQVATTVALNGKWRRAAHCTRGFGWSTANVVDYSFSVEMLSAVYPEAVGVAGTLREPPREHDLSDDSREYSCYAFGWPKRSLRGIVRHPCWRDGRAFGFEDEYIIVLDTDTTSVDRTSYRRPARFLPYDPIFPGFITNTLFYSGVWFGVFFSVGFVKRAVRRKRGRCVKCSYDLRGEFEKGCPECGWNRIETKDEHG